MPDINAGHAMVDELEQERPWLLEEAEMLAGDRGYDDTNMLERLWDDHAIKPVIGIRDMWKAGEDTRQLMDIENVTHDYKGTVYCHCPVSGKEREMANGGFENDRETLKKRCPAKQYGITREGQAELPRVSGLSDSDR
ncbi:hypothetical protein [Salicibibacter cibarius]|uniref:hypothetical protein n=1 Tax=Salicibibacter cibarius TaxID=2743000 RepID=UPI001FE69F69|nr:hypothetical protein [Salicibibacter cibarius]